MPPLSLMIKPVSGLCNMRCRYCFYSDVMARRATKVHEAMSLETLEALVRRAMAYAEGHVGFAFQGGEPTLAGLDFFRELVGFQKKYNARGVRVDNALQTNGLDLSDEMLDFFAREKFLLGVSLDGDRDAHDALRVDAGGAPTYDRVRRTLDRMRGRGVEFNVLCVVNELVAKRPREVFEALEPYGFIQYIACLDDFDDAARPFSLTEASYLEFLKVTLELYLDRIRKGQYVSVRNFDNYVGMLLGEEPENCGMRGRCGQYYLIESDGGVYPSDFYVLDEWKMGDIRDKSFFALEKSAVGERFRSESLAVPERCRACRWYRLCRNGCRRERILPDSANRFCGCYREFFPYALPMLQEAARSFEK
jgi:uncharacterized protein